MLALYAPKFPRNTQCNFAYRALLRPFVAAVRSSKRLLHKSSAVMEADPQMHVILNDAYCSRSHSGIQVCASRLFGPPMH